MNEQDLWADTVAVKAWNKQQATKIINNIKSLFKNVPMTRYWIEVCYYRQGNQFNLFFHVSKRNNFQRSTPIAVIHNIDLDRLIAILKLVREQYNFTIKYTNFAKEQLHRLISEVH